MAERPEAALLWVERERWRLYDASAPEEPLAEILAPDNPLSTGATGLAAALAEHGLSRAALSVAFEGDLCLAAQLEVASPKQARKREALAFGLEEALPVAAEEVAADFCVEGVRVFGVCCDLAWLDRLVALLVKAGADLRCVAPAALLASWRISQDESLSKEIEAVWLGNESVDRVAMNGAIRDWRRHPAGEAQLRLDQRSQGLRSVDRPPRVYVGRSAPDRDVLSEDSGDRFVQSGGDPVRRYAAGAARRIARGEDTPPIDLLRGLPAESRRLHNPLSGDFTLVKVATAALLTAILFVAHSWSGVSGERVDRLESAQADLFRELFPDKRVPRVVRTRLESELRKVAGVRGESSQSPEHRDAALLLQEILAQLPTDLRYRLLELRLEGKRVYLVGETRTHSDADRIAAALRRAGLAVSPPSTQQLADKGVEFRLSAEVEEATGEESS